MLKVNFKNLKDSELIREIIYDRLQDDFERFPELTEDGTSVTVEMENSPWQAGPDLFRIRLRVTKGAYRGVILEKTGKNFYNALSQLDESLVERLSRFQEKKTVIRRKRAREERHAV